MIDFKDQLHLELLILDRLERNHIEGYKELEEFELDLHEIISNVCCNYAYDEKIEDYTPYF